MPSPLVQTALASSALVADWIRFCMKGLGSRLALQTSLHLKAISYNRSSRILLLF